MPCSVFYFVIGTMQSLGDHAQKNPLENEKPLKVKKSHLNWSPPTSQSPANLIRTTLMNPVQIAKLQSHELKNSYFTTKLNFVVICYSSKTKWYMKAIRTSAGYKDTGTPKNAWNNEMVMEVRNKPMAQTAKDPPAMWETQVQSLDGEDPLERGMATHSRLLPGEFHGQSSLVGYSPWDSKKLDTTERLTHTVEDINVWRPIGPWECSIVWPSCEKYREIGESRDRTK